MTNAVKQLPLEAARSALHETPSRGQTVACRPWLRAEIEAVEPDVLVLMGSVAAKSLLGPDFSVLRGRGLVEDGYDGVTTVATVHPSSILRAPDRERKAQLEAFVEDLRLARGLL